MRANLRFGLALPVILMMVFALACAGGKTTGADSQQPLSQAAPIQPASIQPASAECVVVLIDGTGSYKNLPRALQMASQIPPALPGGSVLWVRWITDNSLSDDASILSATIPAEPGPVSNPFDPRQKMDFARVQAERETVLSAIRQALLSLTSPKAGRTDVVGALMAAAERTRENSGLQAKCVLFSDMEDNLSIESTGLALKGIDVLVLGYQNRGLASERARERWMSRLKALGADSVAIRPLDDPTLVADLLGGRS